MTFKRTDLRAVSLDKQSCVEEARKCLSRAKNVASRARSVGHVAVTDHPSPPEMEACLLVQAAQNFRIAGEEFDSASAYASAAAVTAGAVKDPGRAADLYTEAALEMEKVDSEFANEYFRELFLRTNPLTRGDVLNSLLQLSSCRQERISADILHQERMANGHSRKNNYGTTIKYYSRTSKLYTAANMNEPHRLPLLGRVGRLKESASAYKRLSNEVEHSQHCTGSRNTVAFRLLS